MRPVHLLLLLLPLCGYLIYRTTELEGRVARLELSAAGHGVEPTAAGTVASTAPGVTVASPSGGAPASPTSAELSQMQQDIASLRAELDRVREVAKPEQILDLVHQEEARLRNVHIDFHRERWLELREDTLNQLAAQAGFTDFQRERVGELMNQEVDRIAELARDPAVFEDPEKLANDVLQILDETEDSVRHVLNERQRPLWEQRRKFERETVYPWLPR